MNTLDWVTEYRKEKLEEFDKLPIPTWKRINIKDLTIPEDREYNKSFITIEGEGTEGEKATVPEGIYIAETQKGLDTMADFKDFKQYVAITNPFGVSDKLVALGESRYNAGVVVKASKNTKYKETIKIEYHLDEENPLVIDHNIIVAEEDSQITLVMDYYSNDGDFEGFHNGVTKVFAKDRAKVNIIKIQRLNRKAKNFDSNIAFVGREAEVNWILVDLGGDVNGINYINNLEGEESQSNLKSIYFGDGESKLDLCYGMNHYGRRSLSKIETRGALKDQAKKIFRGNLDFKKGSRRSKGDEQEFVLLLDKEVKSHSIPILFSHEDDVEGNHAASAGQIDANKLFYLMSRGFSEKEAKKLIVEASFRPIIDAIPNGELRGIIDSEIHRRLVYDKS